MTTSPACPRPCATPDTRRACTTPTRELWNRNATYPVLGYDDFFTIKDYRLDEKVGMVAGRPPFLAADVRATRGDRELFYAKVVTITSHHPLRPADPRPRPGRRSLDDTQLGDYLRSIDYTDAALGSILDGSTARRSPRTRPRALR